VTTIQCETASISRSCLTATRAEATSPSAELALPSIEIDHELILVAYINFSEILPKIK
jgi:hypothetical protein